MPWVDRRRQLAQHHFDLIAMAAKRTAVFHCEHGASDLLGVDVVGSGITLEIGPMAGCFFELTNDPPTLTLVSALMPCRETSQYHSPVPETAQVPLVIVVRFPYWTLWHPA